MGESTTLAGATANGATIIGMNRRPTPFPSAAPVETHWSRIFYCDIFSGDDDSALHRAEIAAQHPTGLAPPSTDARSKSASRARRDGERITLLAADGYPIVATCYPATGPTRANLVVAGAVGVPQRFYRRFAMYAAASGYSTMTLDYRGVGLSAPTTLKHFRMDYFDWGRLDLAAAVEAMSEPGTPLYIMGHSFGGHGFGVLPNHAKVAGFYTFGTGAGWHGWMPPVEKFKVLLMWNFIGPLLTRSSGYLSWSLLGLGEDLPLDCYRQCKRWCGYQDYFFGDPAVKDVVRSFDQVRAPLMAANAIDDRWAPPKSRDAFIAGFRNAARQTLDIDPRKFGLRAIGHMGYFEEDAVPLWDSALSWLSARPRVGPR